MKAIRQCLVLVILCAGLAAPRTVSYRAAPAANPPSASEIMTAAEAQANAQGKTIFLIFDASW